MAPGQPPTDKHQPVLQRLTTLEADFATIKERITRIDAELARGWDDLLALHDHALHCDYQWGRLPHRRKVPAPTKAK